MASTSSLGATTSTSSAEAQVFYLYFKERLEDLRKGIETSKTRADLDALTSALAEARSLLTEKTGVLPAYDRQKHEESLKEISTSLNEKVKELAPRKKFAFKRSAPSDATQDAQSEQPPSAHSGGAPEDTTSAETQAPANAAAPMPLPSTTPLIRIDDRTTYERAHLAGGVGTGLEVTDAEKRVVDARHYTEAETFEFKASKLLSVTIRNCKRCVIALGEVDGSVFVEGCLECIIVANCRQFRMHESAQTTVLLCTDSIATIEGCLFVKFGSVTPGFCRNFRKKEKTAKEPKPLRVQDFNHVSQLSPSPHWSLLSSEELAAVKWAMAAFLPKQVGWCGCAPEYPDMDEFFEAAGRVGEFDERFWSDGAESPW